MAPAQITLIKTFTYRGAPEEWSNSYHLDAAPADNPSWRDLVDALITKERTCYSDRTTIVRALCYTDSDNPAVYTYILADYAGNVPGSFPPGTGTVAPGDCAGWVRWATGAVSSKGKPVYLRKYFHDVVVGVSGDDDRIATAMVTDYQAYADQLLVTIDGTIAMVGPDGTRPTGPGRAATYVTTRTLKRRGPRP